MSIFSSKRMLFCAVFLCLCIVAVSAQDSSTKQESITENEILLAVDDAQSSLNTTNPANQQPSSFWILLRIILVLLLISGGAYISLYLIKKSGKSSGLSDPYLKNPAGLQLGPNKSVQVITIGDKAFLIGITDNVISLLSEITDRELIDSMKLASEKRAVATRANFCRFVVEFDPRLENEECSAVKENSQGADTLQQDAYSSSAQATADFLRKQRERLQNAGLNRSGGDAQ